MAGAVLGHDSVTVNPFNACRNQVAVIALQRREIVGSENQPFAHGRKIRRQFRAQFRIGDFIRQMVMTDLAEFFLPKRALPVVAGAKVVRNLR